MLLQTTRHRNSTARSTLRRLKVRQEDESAHYTLHCYMLIALTGDSVFKAKTESTEVEDAEVVVESGETEVEKPVDLEEAEEVEEEREDKEQTTTQQQVRMNYIVVRM